MSYFNIVAQSSESTVVTEYKPQDKRSDAYQSEAQLVIFSESVREVDARAFVESGVTEIDFSTRADVRVHPPLAVRCNQLKEIYVPGQLDRLEDNFVEDCPTLRRVCLKWSQTVVNKKAFPENVRIWVL